MKLERAFDFIAYQAENYPKNDALCAKENGQWVQYSTQEVIKTANRLSYGLLKLGIGKGDKIAVVSSNRPEWNFVDLATQQIGAVLVPLYPTITVEDYRYILQHAEVKAVFTGNEDLYNKVSTALGADSSIGIYSFDQLANRPHWRSLLADLDQEDSNLLEECKKGIKPDDLLTIIYTSGTTGKPKGVMLSHRNIVSNTIAIADFIGLPRGTCRVLSFLPLCHIYERTGSYFYTYVGASIYYAESMETIGDNIKEVKPHMFTCVPRLLEKIYDKILAKGYTLSGAAKKLFFWALDLGLRYEPNKDQGLWYNLQLGIARKLIFSKWQEALGGNLMLASSGAAALQPRLARVFWAAGIKICEGYGLTETSPVITANAADRYRMRIGCVGELMPGVQVKIADDGEILCKGPNIMQGYYREPELTAEVLKDGWFHTGDIGEMVEAKYLKITDRKKEMFKTSGGKYIAPQLMENKFKESVYIEQIAIIGNNRKFPSALISPNFDALRSYCERHHIGYTTNAQMVDHPQIQELFTREIAEGNKQFGNWETVKKFKVLPNSFSIEGGELTPTLKLKRRVIDEKYGKEIEEIYA